MNTNQSGRSELQPQPQQQQQQPPQTMSKAPSLTSSLATSTHNQPSSYTSSSSSTLSASQMPISHTPSYDPYINESGLMQSWDETSSVAADNRRFTERRKKTVRFDGQDSDDWSQYESDRLGSQDSATKDSGIDTCSTFTSSEDSNRGDGPKVQTL